MNTAHDPPDDDPALLAPILTVRTRLRDDPDDAPAPTAPEIFEPFSALLGVVLMVPNAHWGFEGVTSDDHPGTCTHVATTGQSATLVKGTDADHIRFPRGYYFVDPTEENGLTKQTAFELVPRRFRMHRLRTYFPERRMGQLSGGTLQSLRTELERLHPEE
jgi:hypothetical protein